jgi:hypothetical protein
MTNVIDLSQFMYFSDLHYNTIIVTEDDMYIYVYVYIYMYIYVYICIYIYICSKGDLYIVRRPCLGAKDDRLFYIENDHACNRL